MRKLLIILILAPVFSFAQTFHIDDSVIFIVKDLSASTAVHEYSEIFNDVGVDTTLRWQVEYVNIPAAWDINFDNQDSAHFNVMDGDSADFTLQSGLTFPQKLIIGATLNGTTGTGRIVFTIFDPNFPAYKRTLTFRFTVTGTSELNESDPFNGNLTIAENMLTVQNMSEFEFRILDVSGKQVMKEVGKSQDLAGKLELQ